MSDICKKTFELQKDEFLEGSSTIEELGEEYDMESDFSGYVLILDPDHTGFISKTD